MKEFLSKYFDLSDYDSWPLAAFFIMLALSAVSDFVIPESGQLIVSLVYFFALIAVVVADTNKLKAAGLEHPSRGWVLLIPIYLWKRDTVTKKSNRRIFFAWVFLFAISMATSWLAISKDQTVAVEQDVCSVLNTIDALKENNVTCERAYNMEEQYDGYWKGNAHLSNNRDVNVSADYNKFRDQGQVYVQIHSLLVE